MYKIKQEQKKKEKRRNLKKMLKFKNLKIYQQN